MTRSIVADLRRMGFSADMIARATVDGKPLAEGDTTTAEKTTSVAVEACPSGTVYITIPGPPPGKPRQTRRDKWKKRPTVVRYREWCDRVRNAVGDSLPAAECIKALNWKAYFEPPKSWAKKRRIAAIGTLHREKPDRDNIDKSVLDCLFQSDQAIAAGKIEKRWDWVARIEIEVIAEEGLR